MIAQIPARTGGRAPLPRGTDDAIRPVNGGPLRCGTLDRGKRREPARRPDVGPCRRSSATHAAARLGQAVMLRGGSAQSEGGGSRPVSRVLSGAAIHLRRTSPCACSDLPGSDAGHASPPDGGSLPYLVLLRVGFALPPVLPPARCALTAPFHPCRAPLRARGGLFSVALSVGSRPPGVTWHPALRSPDFPPPLNTRSSGCPADSRRVQCGTRTRSFKTAIGARARPPAPARDDTGRCGTARSSAPRPPPPAAP